MSILNSNTKVSCGSAPNRVQGKTRKKRNLVACIFCAFQIYMYA